MDSVTGTRFCSVTSADFGAEAGGPAEGQPPGWGTPSVADRVMVGPSWPVDDRSVWLWKHGRFGLLAATAVVCLVSAPAAIASRAPTRSERAAIVAVSPKAAYPAGWYRFVVRVSTANPSWAIVNVEPSTGHEAQVQLDFGLLRRWGHRWHAYGISCGWTKNVPAAVVKDLRVSC